MFFRVRSFSVKSLIRSIILMKLGFLTKFSTEEFHSVRSDLVIIAGLPLGSCKYHEIRSKMLSAILDSRIQTFN